MDSRIGTRIKLSADCPYRAGSMVTITARYSSPMGKGWVVLFDDGKDMAIFDRHIA